MIRLAKNKSRINLAIDALMFIVLMAIAGLGFLIKYVLLPGYKINEKYDTNTDLLFLGLDRHQWGSVHLYLAFFMLFLLLLHIILHWEYILCIFRNLMPGRTGRTITGLSIGILGLTLAVIPFGIKPEVIPQNRNYMNNRATERSGRIAGQKEIYSFSEESYYGDAGNTAIMTENENPGSTADTISRELRSQPVEAVNSHHGYSDIDINGTMTLREIAVRYNLNLKDLAEAINVTVQFSGERLGRLRKQYGFEIHDLKSFIEESKSKSDD